MRLEITRRAELAIHTLAFLDGSPDRVKAPVLAHALGTTARFVPHVLSPLVKAGWVSSDPGPTGGYRCRVPVGAVTLLEVIEAVEGPIDNGRCVVVDDACRPDSPCLLHLAWAKARNELVGDLRATTIADVRAAPQPPRR